MEETKRCSKCGEVKPLSEFYAQKKAKDGKYSYCRECYRAYDRTRNRSSEERKAYNLKYKLKYQGLGGKGREKHLVRQRTNYAISAGRLVRQSCEVCGELKVEAHHDDYSKPLEVRWLCKKHHIELHNRLREERRNAKN